MTEASRESVEGWKRNPWSRLPTWGKWAVGVIGAILLIGIGAVIGSGEEDDLKAEVSDLEARLVSAHDERNEAQDELEAIEERRAKIFVDARERANLILSGAKHESEEAEENLDSLEAEVAGSEEELGAVEASLEGAREERAKSTIPGNGTFQAEVDFIPGTYRSPGGEGCYWATLNSADPFDIASNENATGPTIASITTPYFQTQDCGSWKRIGE